MIQVQRSQVNTSSAGPIATATALASFPDRVGFSIQNQATSALFVKFGASASTSNYDIVLKGGAGAADGSGGAIFESGPLVYTGIITVAASGTPSYSSTDW
jgi:hypothetical protein